MTYLAYALLGLLLLVPVVAADEPLSIDGESCAVLVVWYDPPDYRFDPDCLKVPPSP